MSSGVFSIEADIVPVIDERQLSQQAAQISRQFSAVLAKQAPTIPIAVDTKSFQKNIFDTTKIMEVLNHNITGVKDAIATTVDAGRVGFLKFADAVNLTNTKFIQYSGNIREAIANNTKFKAALDVVKNSSGAIQNLPDSFKNLSAQIASGTSNLQLAAQRGSTFAQSFVPFLLIGERVSRELAQVNTALQQMAVNIGRMAQASGAGQKGLTLFATESDRLKAVFTDIAGKVSPQLGQQLLNTFDTEVVKGPQALIDVLKKLGPVATDGLGQVVNVGKIVRSSLFDIDRASLSLTDQIAERFSRLGAKIKGSGVANTIRKELSDDTLKTGFLDTFELRLDDVKRRSITGLKAIGTALNETFTNTKIGQDLAGSRDAVVQFGSVIGKTVGDGVKIANNELQKLTVSFQTGGISGAAKTVAEDVKKSFTGLFKLGGEGGGQAGAASISLLTAPLRGLKALLGGVGSVAELPFKALGGAAKLAAAPVGILKNVVSGALGDIGGLGIAAGGITAAIIGIGAAALQTAAKFETYRVAFDGLFGPGAGEKVLNLALEFDKLTHFSLETTVQSVEQLAGAIRDIQPEGALAILKQLGGAAAAVGAGGDQIQRVVLAITQMSAAGRVTAQDLNQITQALPDISRVRVYNQIAKDLGVTNAAAKKLAGEGLVDSQTGLAAVLKVAHDVPGATEAMVKQSQTFNGLMTIVQTQLKKVLVEIGGAILPAAKIVLDGLVLAFEKLGPVLVTVGHAIQSFFGFLSHIPGISGVVNRLINGMNNELHGTSTAAASAGDELQAATDALDTFKNAAAAIKSALPGANAEIVDLAAKARLAHDATLGISTGITAGLGSLGSAFDSIKAALNTGFDFQAQVNGLATLKAGVDDLTNTHDINALSSGLDTLQKFMGTLHLPPDITKKFDEFFAVGRDKVDNFNVSFGETLKKVLSAGDAFDAQAAAQKAVTQAQQSYDDLVKEHTLKHDEDQLRLSKELTTAKDRETDANNNLTDAQTALNKAMQGASSEDLEKADLSLASAKLQLRQLIEDEKKALDELNKTQQTGVDLTGLSVAQIKTRLSVAHAALAAQKAAQTPASGKSAEQKDIDALNATIARRNAELQIKDATIAIDNLKAKGLASDPEVIAANKAVAQAKKAQQDAAEATITAQTTLNKLDQEDIPFKRQLAAAQDAITAAHKASAKADSDAAIAVATAKGDQIAINAELEKQIKEKYPALQVVLDASTTSVDQRVKREQDFGQKIDDNIGKVRTLNDLIAAGATAAPDVQASVDKKIKDTLNSAVNDVLGSKDKGIQFKLTPTGETFTSIGNGILTGEKSDKLVSQLDPKDLLSLLLQKSSVNVKPEDLLKSQGFAAALNSSDVLNTVTTALLNDPKSDLRKLFQQLFKQLGFTLPGFAEGAIVDRATHGVFGENGREVILPLTKPARLMELLSNTQVLHPVLAALGKITLPSNKLPNLNQMDRTPTALTLEPTRISGSGSSDGLSRLEQAKQHASLAKAIVSEMKDAGFNGQKVINNDFTIPQTDDPLSSVHMRQIAREVKRQIDKELG